jgi:molybdopterin-binding protein
VKQIRQRLTYANVMSSIAVFLLIGGATAFAALGRNTVGTKQLKRNSVSAEKIKREAVSKQKLRTNSVITEKILNNAVTTPKIPDGAVITSKIPDSAVTSAKLDTGERSQAVSFSAGTAFDLFDSYDPATWTTVMSLNLPDGNWVVVANVGLSINSVTETHAGCRLNQNGSVLAQAGTEGERVSAGVPSLDGIDLTAVAGGGMITVTCGDTLTGTSAVNRTLTAIRAGSVTAG